VHMVMHMSLSMLAPILLVQGGVITLILRTARVDRRRVGVHGWVTQVLHWRALRLLYHPAVVFVIFIGSYYGLYFTPLFEAMMRFHWAHQLMNLHFLVTGYAYYSLIIGVDRPPRPLPQIGKLGYTFAAMPFHAFFGVAIYSAPTLFAQTYYDYLDLPWADLWEAQKMAGAVAWAGGEIPLIIAVVSLSFQWARQDDREARRRDRHLDRGFDREFDAYTTCSRSSPTGNAPDDPRALRPARPPPPRPTARTDHRRRLRDDLRRMRAPHRTEAQPTRRGQRHRQLRHRTRRHRRRRLRPAGRRGDPRRGVRRHRARRAGRRMVPPLQRGAADGAAAPAHRRRAAHRPADGRHDRPRPRGGVAIPRMGAGLRAARGPRGDLGGLALPSRRLEEPPGPSGEHGHPGPARNHHLVQLGDHLHD